MSSNSATKAVDVIGAIGYSLVSGGTIARHDCAYPSLIYPKDAIGQFTPQRVAPNPPVVAGREDPTRAIAAWYPVYERGPKWYRAFDLAPGTYLESLLAYDPVGIWEPRQVRLAHWTNRYGSGQPDAYHLSSVVTCKLLRLTKASELRVRITHEATTYTTSYITELVAGHVVSP